MMSERWVAEVIPWFPGADLKACFTFFAMCAEDGNKLPLISVAKGRTERCHRQFGSPGYPNEVRHSPSGWWIEDLAVAPYSEQSLMGHCIEFFPRPGGIREELSPQFSEHADQDSQ
jgi:hypothetical protein